MAALRRDLVPEALDRMLRTHADVLRRLMKRHSGYESAVEAGGATFVIAFHSPKDALLFGLEAQSALLAVEWAPEVLAHEAGAPLYVDNM